MKRIIVQKQEGVCSSKVNTSTPVFAKKNGRIVGMIICEDDGWILRLGGKGGAYGFCDDRDECITEGIGYGYEFFIED